MNRSALTLLRLGLAATFFLFGVLILIHPSLWANLLQSWAHLSLHGSLRPFLTAIASIDIVIGALLTFDLWTSVTSLVGAAVVLLTFLLMIFTDMSVLAVCMITSSIALGIQTKRNR
jgi:uncharacterized membrane protein YphA (DoxX/SURF4 family)